MASERHFHWADYLVFASSLVLSVAISIYNGFLSRRTSGTSEYLMGGRHMGVLPVSVSLVVSLVSAIFMLAYPAETYLFGVYPLLWLFGVLGGITVAILFFIPVFHRLRLTSVHEYLGRRFSNTVRTICSIMTMTQMILFSSVAMYAPSIAISHVSGCPQWVCIILSSVFCTFYTTVGGFRTVLWTDALQCLFMAVGLAATLAKGATDVGGLGFVFNVSSLGRRTHISNFYPDLTASYDIWTWLLGTFPIMVGNYATCQWSVQRFCSIATMNKARLAALLTVPIFTLFVLLAVGAGLLAYTYYFGCDPFLTGRIKTPDQIFPLLVMDVFHNSPGMPGLFVAGVFSAALSTVSSMQHSFTALLLEDVIKPFALRCRGRRLTESQATVTSRLIIVILGVVVGSFALGSAKLGKLILTLTYAAMSIGVAPVLGVFTLGLFVPFANTKGAICGLCTGIAILVWLLIGTMTISKDSETMLPLSTALCQEEFLTNASNASVAITSAVPAIVTALTTESISTGYLTNFYRIKYHYYGLVGVTPVIVVGIIISLVTGGFKARKHVNAEVLFSFQTNCFQCTKENPKSEEETENNVSLVQE